MARAELTGLFDMMRSMPPPQSIAELRVGMEGAIPFFNANPPTVGGIESGVEIGNDVRAEILAPSGTPPFPVLIYLHGGGWSIGSPATHHKVARQLCAGAGALVVNVDYRLAPEHPFPTPLDDCVAAVRWTRSNIARFGGDPSRLAIGGDSAGGNLSAAAINDLRNEIQFRAALLIYGAFDVLGCRRDYDKWAPEEDPVLPKHSMDLMLGAYLSGGASNDDPRVSPIKADLRHFPPACLLCGTWDPLIGDSRALHAKLTALGRESTLHEYDGMPHAFVQLPCTDADAAIATACEFLRAKFR
ncbi:MAG TPA: alpha/beta hydrolase [Pseudomonadales bacterium]|nr:alpha/beta hydrolase [Pseudomonadales bacterium]